MPLHNSLTTALCLPDVDVAALNQGRMIAALAHNFLPGANQFVLCPVPSASAKAQSDDVHNLTIRTWATLTARKIYNQSEEMEAIAKLTIWSEDVLREVVSRRHRIFVVFLRVYQLAHPVEIPLSRVSGDKIGKVIRTREPALGDESTPVLDDSTFHRRCKELEHLYEPQHVVLEKLQAQLLQGSELSIGGRSLSDDIQTFLGWSSARATATLDSDLAWIQQIAKVGNSSDGHEFEKLVRRSLLKLGFSNSETNPKASLNPQATGGAGGIDAYCENPFPLVAECKASGCAKVPHDVTGQLYRICLNHIGRTQYESAIKIIFATGYLTDPTNNSAVEASMNIIQPETLQRLTELKAKYPGSIDLLQLKECLENDPFGINADKKVNDFVDQISEGIRLRSFVVAHVKEYLSRLRGADCEATRLYDTFDFANPNCLSREEFDAILSELSSPLVGCLGRRKAPGLPGDCFYYLRDLVID